MLGAPETLWKPFVLCVFQKIILMCLKMGEVRPDFKEQLSRKSTKLQELKKIRKSRREKDYKRRTEQVT